MSVDEIFDFIEKPENKGNKKKTKKKKKEGEENGMVETTTNSGLN
jgi:hypothetical protein